MQAAQPHTSTSPPWQAQQPPSSRQLTASDAVDTKEVAAEKGGLGLDQGGSTREDGRCPRKRVTRGCLRQGSRRWSQVSLLLSHSLSLFPSLLLSPLYLCYFRRDHTFSNFAHPTHSERRAQVILWRRCTTPSHGISPCLLILPAPSPPAPVLPFSLALLYCSNICYLFSPSSFPL